MTDPNISDVMPDCTCGRPLSDVEARMLPVIQERDEARAEVERLRGLVRVAVASARTFNRGGMTWGEYDRLLAQIELEASDITALPPDGS